MADYIINIILSITKFLYKGIEKAEKAPTQFITDKEELLQYQGSKRKGI